MRLWFLQRRPHQGKSQQGINEFSKLFHAKVELVYGFASRHKKLLLKNVKKAEVKHVLPYK